MTSFWESLAIMGFFIALGMVIGYTKSQRYHAPLCIELLDQAKTGQDTVLVLTDDEWCVTVLKETQLKETQ